MKFNGVVFDFNGTLLFDDAFHVEAWDKISMEVCGEHLTAEMMDTKYAGFPNKEILRRLSDDTLTEEQLLSLSLRKEELYREIVRNVPGGPKLVPGAEELFDFLKTNGIPCTIASASIIQNIEFFVDIFHLDRWFDMDHIIYDDGSYLSQGSPVRQMSGLRSLPSGKKRWSHIIRISRRSSGSFRIFWERSGT